MRLTQRDVLLALIVERDTLIGEWNAIAAERDALKAELVRVRQVLSDVMVESDKRAIAGGKFAVRPPKPRSEPVTP